MFELEIVETKTRVSTRSNGYIDTKKLILRKRELLLGDMVVKTELITFLTFKINYMPCYQSHPVTIETKYSSSFTLNHHPRVRHHSTKQMSIPVNKYCSNLQRTLLGKKTAAQVPSRTYANGIERKHFRLPFRNTRPYRTNRFSNSAPSDFILNK